MVLSKPYAKNGNNKIIDAEWHNEREWHKEGNIENWQKEQFE